MAREVGELRDKDEEISRGKIIISQTLVFNPVGNGEELKVLMSKLCF